ncbi:hypothetical protein [Streptomyces tropicalis]|uniref:Serine/threonine protein kinase n=1 Tax=Streptomyces tropicalis TaxID=3034234 RepID=A0ABT6A0Y8_9ACTN|nr:hypothetical protein [Streptomyces tropicalis]MDF3298305.1 hypothetical protein [Streptomyces tropicalis]
MGRLLAAFAVTALVGGGAGAGVWYVARGHVGTGTGAAPVVSAPAATPATVPVTATAGGDAGPAAPGAAPAPASPSDRTDAASPVTGSVPDGYRRVRDPLGYTLDVPTGWTRRQKEGEKAPVVTWDAPDGGRRLQIFALAEDSPAASLDLAENDPGYGFARQPGYQALSRDASSSWSEITYRYDDPGLGARRVIDHRFRAADGTLYAIRAGGPETLSPDELSTPLATALASFCPPGGRCGG